MDGSHAIFLSETDRDDDAGSAMSDGSPVAQESAQETFGHRLRKRRLMLDMGRVELAKRLGVSKVTVWNWERDRSMPRPKIRKRLAEVVGWSEQELMFGTPEVAVEPVQKSPMALAATIEAHRAQIARLAGTRPEDVTIKIEFGK